MTAVRAPAQRRRLLTGIALALPWASLALAEGALRMADVGHTDPLFVPYADDRRFLMTNDSVGRRWFRGAFVPSTHLDFFRATRGPRTLRLVFQGESSGAGFPYGHGGAPSRMLEARLQATFPDRDVEVVNTALTAVSSYVLLDQADEIVAQRPDAVLIYAGHNEYYGVFGAASTRALGGSRGVVRAYLTLRRLRIVQLVERLVSPRGARTDPGTPTAASSVMELMAGEQLVPLGSDRYRAGLAQFRANLDALLARYRAARIPVFVGTLVSNERDQPPFVSVFAPGVDSVAWRREYAAGVAALAHGDVATAERSLGAAWRLDSTVADGLFALGRVREARGDSARARLAYRAAKERDALRFRAPDAMNAIVRDVAARRGATVVETERAVERASPLGTPGRTLILEHLHPNLDGYFVVADAFYEALRARGAFGTWPAPVGADVARRLVPTTPLDSLAAIMRTDRLTAAWPFRPRGTSIPSLADTLRPRTLLDSLAQRLVDGRVSWAEATDRLRAQREAAGDVDGALRASYALAAEYRYSAQPYLDAARVAAAHGRVGEALRAARLANARRETAASAAQVGLLALRAGDSSAVRDLERAAALAPGDDVARRALAAARMLPYLMSARARAPRDTSLLYKLAAAYALTSQPDSARAALRALLAVAPRHEAGRALLAQIPPGG